MGKQFKKAKKEIEKLKDEKHEYDLQLNEIQCKIDMIDEDIVTLQRKWYGVADGDVASISSLEKFFLATKRWVK